MLQLLTRRLSKASGGISPTAISNYLRCQLRFFYRYVSNLQEPDENDDELIDNRLFGNIFHRSAELVYLRFGHQRITSADLDNLLKSAVEIEQAVDRAIKEELFQIKDPMRQMPALDGLQLINREVIIKYVRLLLEVDRRLTPFTIIALEKRYMMPWGDTEIGGIIDRLDSVTDPETGEERIRVIDYKTGARRLRALPNVEAIFAPEYIKEHSDYYLQAFLYSHIIRRDVSAPVSPSLLFIQHAGADDYDPTLCLGKEPVHDIASVSETYLQLLEQKTGEIFNSDLAFTPTADSTRCRTCPYATLCGR